MASVMLIYRARIIAQDHTYKLKILTIVQVIVTTPINVTSVTEHERSKGGYI